MKLFDAFRGKTVLVTGDTGFKGTWLISWLLRLGARVTGFAIDIPTDPSHFSAASLENKISQMWGDVRDPSACKAALESSKPDFLFHLAAQPLVRRSYSEPALTFETNVLGSLNLLEALRAADRKCVAVFITSDKCYDNVEQVWGYRETDRLGGKDPYSGSKGAAELVIRSYAESFFKKPGSPVRIAVGRAGNVIGGGDWAKDRIVPDAIQAWHNKTALQVRRPSATRPWQHVLEPLSGYLTLAALLAEDEGLNGEAFNFGPPAEQVQTVGELLDEMIVYWPDSTWQDASTEKGVYEAGLLKLCCDKALHRLLWKPTLSFYETVQLTSQWYRMFYSRTEAPGDAAWECTQDQIARYEALARDRGVSWAT